MGITPEQFKEIQERNENIVLPEPDLSVETLRKKLNINISDDFTKTPTGKNMLPTKEDNKMYLRYPLFLITNIQTSELFHFVKSTLFTSVNQSYEDNHMERVRQILATGKNEVPDKLEMVPLLVADSRGGFKFIGEIYPSQYFVRFCELLHLEYVYYVSKGNIQPFNLAVDFDYSDWNEYICPSEELCTLVTNRNSLELDTITNGTGDEEEILQGMIKDELGAEAYHTLLNENYNGHDANIDFKKVNYKPPTPENLPVQGTPIPLENEEESDMVEEVDEENNITYREPTPEEIHDLSWLHEMEESLDEEENDIEGNTWDEDPIE